jgi:hypothetical protein
MNLGGESKPSHEGEDAGREVNVQLTFLSCLSGARLAAVGYRGGVHD